VNPACLLLLVGLGADGVSHRDAGVPPWAPRVRPVDVSAEAEYRLRQVGEGYLYVSPRFEARVGRDGLVNFKDRRGSITFPFFDKVPLPRGPTLESTVRDYLGKRRGRKNEPPPEPEPEPYWRRMEPSEVCPPRSPCYVPETATAIKVRGSFDLTDEIMRGLGQDPYASEKARFLSATFEFRIKLAIAARRADLKREIGKLPERLDELLGDGRYSARERRRILYELWRETDRDVDGERAASIIRDFVRRRLPCGAADGYTRAELDVFAHEHPERLLIAPGDCGD
jgi:hypothetical protein